MTIRNYFCFGISFTLLLTALTCTANNKNIKPTPTLLNGTASYQEVLQWSKQRTSADKDFPITINAKCGNMALLFIQETPTCGTINCHYLMFKQNQPKTYFYIDEVEFSAIRLFCYPKAKDYTYYLFSSLNESNAAGTLQLGKIQNNHYQQKAVRQIDYTNLKLNQAIDSMWEKQPEEKQLLEFFSQTK